jgi:hypothetical protein
MFETKTKENLFKSPEQFTNIHDLNFITYSVSKQSSII